MSADRHTQDFGAVYTRMRGSVLSLAYQMLGDAALSEDVLQETFLLVHRHLPQFRGDSDIGTWVYRIAMRAAMRMRRLRSRKPQSLAAADAHVQSSDHVLAEREEESRRLYEALEKLPADQRAVITLLSLREIPVKQVAEILDCPEGTVWSRAYHARQKLREILAANHPPTRQL